ncbi:3-hydroxybutyryl-CoA dehydrogenase [Actinocrispum wychmicini]|uniref:3-hydroxybutyryl-CoA dehydrogenase n=1 Tax=Actinocrispum wychmicini TaxID=1213861 RepID=UPI00104425DC|nr:3-hydroxybutyryl-CoA dehydrogenase [Actinocrispum wychmicini]
MPEIERVAVIGCGTMGSGVAEVLARAGLEVHVLVSSAPSERAGRGRLGKSLDRAVRKNKLTESDRAAIVDRIRFTTELGALEDRQLVVEAIGEDDAAKTALLRDLSKVLRDPDAIVATTTSAIPIVRLARVTDRPGQVVGMHFFNPAPVLPLVELIGSVLTTDETMARADHFVTDVLGKQVIESPDRAGFVVNALLFPYLLSAIRMVGDGTATPEVIDRAMVKGCAHPMGPLALADLIGLDTTVAIADAMYEEFKQPLYAPPPLLSRMVEGGLLGKKSGRGFYDYSENGSR